MKRNDQYNGGLTREQFLFSEARMVARLRADGMGDADIVTQVVAENLFQYPTERMSRNIAQVCLRRLDTLASSELACCVASAPISEAKLVHLYAIMRDNGLVWTFMLSVIAQKYRSADYHFGREDVNVFFARLQQQDDRVAKWSESTLTKIKQVLVRMLIECGYLDSLGSNVLNRVYAAPGLMEGMRQNGDTDALAAFHCF